MRHRGGWVWLCQMPNFTSNVPFPLIFRDGDGRRRFPPFFFRCDRAVPFLLLFHLLSFSLSPFLSPHFPRPSGVPIVNRTEIWASASVSANANTQLILRRAKGRILARSQTFPSWAGSSKREPGTERSHRPIVLHLGFITSACGRYYGIPRAREIRICELVFIKSPTQLQENWE